MNVSASFVYTKSNMYDIRRMQNIKNIRCTQSVYFVHRTSYVYILKSTRKDLYDKYYAMIIFALPWKFVRKI